MENFYREEKSLNKEAFGRTITTTKSYDRFGVRMEADIDVSCNEITINEENNVIEGTVSQSFKGDIVINASCGDRGELLSIKTCDINLFNKKSVYNFSIPADKAMLWKELNTMIPVCDAAENN